MKQALFESWCASQGISSPLKLQGADTSYRYMSCDREVTGDLLQVPLKACITADSSESLADRLAFEKSLGDDSEFAPFIDLYPSLEDLEDVMPRFWSPSRLDKVTDGGQLQRRIKESEREGIDPWALACVNSRCNYLNDLSYALTPVLDMLNHSPLVPTRAEVKDDNFVLSIGNKVPVGKEVFISYGYLTNLETLSEYGFVSPDNPCNEESLLVKMIRQPPVGVVVDRDGAINVDAIAKLREYVANMYGIENESSDELFLQPISDSNEEEVFSFLATYLQEAIDEAEVGAKLAQGDDLVTLYLTERAKTLERGVSWVKKKFPNLEY